MRFYTLIPTCLIVISLGLVSCQGDNFLKRLALPTPPPTSAPDAPKNPMPDVLPLPTPMTYPLPRAQDGEKQSWQNHDLTFLSGCWKLGEERHRTYYLGGEPKPCTLSALSVCFDDKGQSTETHMYYDFDDVHHDCQPPMKATFGANNHLIIEATQEVLCSNGLQDNLLDQYDCVYDAMGLADCVYHILGHPEHPDEGIQAYLKRVSKTK